jgi:hypothetical protein
MKNTPSINKEEAPYYLKLHDEVLKKLSKPVDIPEITI